MPEGDVERFLVPDLGEGLEEATIVSWSVAAGAEVALNDPLCVLETAKAEVEIPSPYAGTVTELGGAPGETLRVGTLLAAIRTAPQAASTRRATLVGYGVDEQLDRSRRGRRGGHRPPNAPRPAEVHRPRAKPPVRRLARQLGVDLAVLAPGHGPEGSVTRAQVEAAAAAVPTPPAGRPVDEPVTGVRARIAHRMTRSRAEIPDATCSVAVDFGEALALRAALNERLERAGARPVVTPFALACHLFVRAVVEHPVLNASYDAAGPSIRRHAAVHLGVAVATDRGLVVAVVRDAHERGAVGLAEEIDRLSAAARAGTVTPAELVGSTITVSNFGALGLDEGIPVINHPEAAILGLGAVRERPAVVDGLLAVRRVATATLAFDHRVADGADAAALLTTFRDFLEQPGLALGQP